MKLRKTEIVRLVHAVPHVQFESQGLSSFGGLVVFAALFDALDLAARLRRCFAHLGNSRVYGMSRVAMQLVVHVLIGFRRLRDTRLLRDRSAGMPPDRRVEVARLSRTGRGDPVCIRMPSPFMTTHGAQVVRPVQDGADGCDRDAAHDRGGRERPYAARVPRGHAIAEVYGMWPFHCGGSFDSRSPPPMPERSWAKAWSSSIDSLTTLASRALVRATSVSAKNSMTLALTPSPFTSEPASSPMLHDHDGIEAFAVLEPPGCRKFRPRSRRRRAPQSMHVMISIDVAPA